MKLTVMQRAIAIGELQAGRRDKDVAQTFGVDVRTIRGLLLRYQQTNDVKDRHRSGRPRITSSYSGNSITQSFHHIN
jgi:transposase